MSISPGNSKTVAKHTGVGSVTSETKNPPTPLEYGREQLDYKTLTIAKTSITEQNPGVFTSTAHGLVTNDQLTYHKVGSTALAFASGSVADGSTYYVKYVDADTFQLTSEPDGTGLQVTNDGSDTQTFSRGIGKVT